MHRNAIVWEIITDQALSVHVAVVSYPDPNVRNDDHRLQYDITYREKIEEHFINQNIKLLSISYVLKTKKSTI